jgi:hypothetical protein
MNFKKIFYSFSHIKNKEYFLVDFATNCTLPVKKESLLGIQLGKGVYGSTFVKKGSSDRCVKLVGTGIKEEAFSNKHKFNHFFTGAYAEAKAISDIIHGFLEAFYIHQSRVTKITPKLYDFYFIKKDGKIFPAIEMEKVDGTKLTHITELKSKTNNSLFAHNNKLFVGQKKQHTLQQYINKKMKLAKLEHKDSHWGNIFIGDDNKIKVIDFSSPYIKYKINNKFKFLRLYIKEKKVIFAKQERKRKYTIKFTRRL